jgi:alpha-methylacyl-CoA racemase
MTWPAAPWADGTGPLADLRVLDFSVLLPGPFCTALLADLGADVIKIEAPGGDPARELGDGIHGVANRNKRSVAADLKTDEGRATCLRLAANADVVVEGFRPGVVDRLGVGYADIRRVNRSVVYCSVSGFGQHGPWRSRSGHDLTFLAASGALSFSSHWGEPPRRSGVPVADLAASTLATIAILASLRERDRTGQGCYLDAAIADAALAFISPRGGPDFALGADDQRSAYPTNDLFETADGELLAVSVVETKFWQRFRRTVLPYAPELGNARFDSPADRRRHGDELKAILVAMFAGRTAAQWLALFADVDVAVQPVRTVAEAAHAEQTATRHIVQCCQGVEQVVFPVLRDDRPLGRLRSPAPALGAHTDAVLDELA